jgi:tRNA-dihydrouridine synthase
MKDRYGVDGILIGRAAVGNPWIFREVKEYLETGQAIPPPSLSERIKTLRLHLEKSVAYKGERATLYEMRKVYNGYFKGIAGFKPHRIKLVTAVSLQEIEMILREIQELQ